MTRQEWEELNRTAERAKKIAGPWCGAAALVRMLANGEEAVRVMEADNNTYTVTSRPAGQHITGAKSRTQAQVIGDMILADAGITLINVWDEAWPELAPLSSLGLLPDVHRDAPPTAPLTSFEHFGFPGLIKTSRDVEPNPPTLTVHDPPTPNPSPSDDDIPF